MPKGNGSDAVSYNDIQADGVWLQNTRDTGCPEYFKIKKNELQFV